METETAGTCHCFTSPHLSATFSVRIFGTDGIRATAGQFPLDHENVWRIGFVTGKLYNKYSRGSRDCRILLARDTRSSGEWIERDLSAGLAESGCSVFTCGVSPTSSIAAVLKKKKFAGGAVISASHNPAEFNGIKFFAANGEKIPDGRERETEKLLEGAHSLSRPSKIVPARRYPEGPAEYMRFLKSSVPRGFSLKGLKWVADCANGSACGFAPKLLRSFGAQVTAINCKPDGKNINLKCGALHPELLQQAVTAERAHGGCAFDGDADRVLFVDEKGRVQDGDILLTLLAEYMKSKNRLKNSAVVTTVMANFGFFEEMKKRGIKVITTAVGDKAVSDAMKTSGAKLGGEQSGHIIFSDELPTGDGPLTMLKVLEAYRGSGRPLSSFTDSFRKFPQVLMNLKVSERVPLDTVPKVQSAIRNAESRLNGRGRVLVRYSGTEPLLRVMVEGDSLPEIEGLADGIIRTAKENIG